MEADFLQMALIKFARYSLFRMPFKNLSSSNRVYICTSVGIKQVQRVVHTWMFAAADTKYSGAYEWEIVTKYPICGNLSK
jgi:hypothetical protein